MRASLVALSAVLLLAALAPALARADVPPPGPVVGVRDPGWWAPIGLSVGGSAGLGERGGGFLLGAEVSAVYLSKLFWVGGWTDAVYVFGIERTRVSVGAEAGWFLFGLELGYSAELGGAEAVHALRTGFVVTGGILGGYVRWRHALSASGDDVEAGVLLKWPLPLE